MNHRGDSRGQGACRKLAKKRNQPSGRGASRLDQLECNLRATLCRQLAQREPENRTLWIAEAENWSRLSKERNRGAAEEAEEKISFRHHGEFAGAVGSGFFIPGVARIARSRDPNVPADAARRYKCVDLRLQLDRNATQLKRSGKSVT